MKINASQIKVCESQDEPYCFISYSHRDRAKVLPILSQLTGNGCRIWYDNQIQSGVEWANYIHKWLTHENCHKFIIFVSRNSIASDNVQDEVHLASKYQKSRLVIYLDNVDLTGGMELHLDRWQSIKWYEEPQEIFMRKLFKGVPPETMAVVHTTFRENSEFTKKYQLLEVIGQGGSALVYKARMYRTGTVVTVKVSDYPLENGKHRVLLDEKAALEKLFNCPFVPRLIDYGTDIINGERKDYLVESYIDGATLADIRNQMGEAEIVMILQKCAQILQYFHKNGVDLVHGDIKPGNIMVDAYNNLYLIDLGSCVPAFSRVNWKTTTFASPEINQGQPVDVRSDIFSLGMTVKYLLLKENLQRRGMKFKEALELPIAYFGTNMSGLLELIVEKMLDVRLERRFQSLNELLRLTEEYQRALAVWPGYILRDYKALPAYKDPYKTANSSDPFGDTDVEIDHSAVLDITCVIPGSPNGVPDPDLQQPGYEDPYRTMNSFDCAENAEVVSSPFAAQDLSGMPQGSPNEVPNPFPGWSPESQSDSSPNSGQTSNPCWHSASKPGSNPISNPGFSQKSNCNSPSGHGDKYRHFKKKH